MPKLTLSSDDLPSHFSNAARKEAYLDRFRSVLANAEIDALPDARFHGRIEAVAVGAVGLATTDGTLATMKRTRAGIVADGSDAPCVCFNVGPQSFHLKQAGREIVVPSGGATLFTEGIPGAFSFGDSPDGADSCKNLVVRMPRPLLSPTIANPEDRLLRLIGVDSEAFHLLKANATGLLAMGGLKDPATSEKVSAHLVDLVTLALGANSEATEIARERGLKEARLGAIVGEITRGFANPDFSVTMAAKRLRLSVRHLQRLLHATGTSFAERVMELRLQRACELLARADTTHRKVSDIALSSGFNDLSYFHASFRRRFGMTPSGARCD